MDNFILMKILEASYHVGNKKFSLPFIKLSSLANMVSQIAAINVIHEQVQVLSVLEGCNHINDERVL